jgi:hypothetical protein
MVLYTSSRGAVYRLRDFMMVADVMGPNFSEDEWDTQQNPKTGKDFYVKRER